MILGNVNPILASSLVAVLAYSQAKKGLRSLISAPHPPNPRKARPLLYTQTQNKTPNLILAYPYIAINLNPALNLFPVL